MPIVPMIVQLVILFEFQSWLVFFLFLFILPYKNLLLASCILIVDFVELEFS